MDRCACHTVQAKIMHIDRELQAANDAALAAKDELFTVRLPVSCVYCGRACGGRVVRWWRWEGVW